MNSYKMYEENNENYSEVPSEHVSFHQQEVSQQRTHSASQEVPNHVTLVRPHKTHANTTSIVP